MEAVKQRAAQSNRSYQMLEASLAQPGQSATETLGQSEYNETCRQERLCVAEFEKAKTDFESRMSHLRSRKEQHEASSL